MTSMNRGRAASSVSLAVVAGLTALTFACTPSEILEVEDPDIINPSNVQSQAGAEAVRLGAMSRFNNATTGSESFIFLGGLFSDEWINGDSYIDRQQWDQRIVIPENAYLLSAYRAVQRTRLSAKQAIELIRKYNTAAPGWQVGEMFMAQAYVINSMAEVLCDGLVISDVVEGREEYGKPMTTQAAFEQALALANEGLTAVTGSTASDVRVRNALALTKGRILANLNRQAEAATAVAGIPTTFQYLNYQSQTTYQNAYWDWNLNSRRYSVGEKEGTNGMDFVTAKDPRVPVCAGGDAACKAIGVTNTVRDDLTGPFNVLMLWTTRDINIPLMQGVDARMIEAEAALKAGDAAGALTILNAARATKTGLAPLTDAGTADARLSQLFRERAFWQYGRGYRQGDLRRLVRQYARPWTAVYPTGPWHKGGNYGADVTVPVPQAEQNNPNIGVGVEICINRNA
jgi:starch-binding outer membrane protein, SusD/RagB family